jgi:hypothetical protein
MRCRCAQHLDLEDLSGYCRCGEHATRFSKIILCFACIALRLAHANSFKTIIADMSRELASIYWAIEVAVVV